MKRALTTGVFFICFALAGFSQCQGKITLLSVDEGTTAAHDGRIKIQLQGSADYKVLLLKSTDGQQEVTVKEISNNGPQIVSFDGLDETQRYRVRAEFRNETQPMCRKRETDYLELVKNKTATE